MPGPRSLSHTHRCCVPLLAHLLVDAALVEPDQRLAAVPLLKVLRPAAKHGPLGFPAIVPRVGHKHVHLAQPSGARAAVEAAVSRRDEILRCQSAERQSTERLDAGLKGTPRPSPTDQVRHQRRLPRLALPPQRQQVRVHAPPRGRRREQPHQRHLFTAAPVKRRRSQPSGTAPPSKRHQQRKDQVVGEGACVGQVTPVLRRATATHVAVRLERGVHTHVPHVQCTDQDAHAAHLRAGVASLCSLPPAPPPRDLAQPRLLSANLAPPPTTSPAPPAAAAPRPTACASSRERSGLSTRTCCYEALVTPKAEWRKQRPYPKRSATRCFACATRCAARRGGTTPVRAAASASGTARPTSRARRRRASRRRRAAAPRRCRRRRAELRRG